jgi:hypothetical protein
VIEEGRWVVRCRPCSVNEKKMTARTKKQVTKSGKGGRMDQVSRRRVDVLENGLSMMMNPEKSFLC